MLSVFDVFPKFSDRSVNIQTIGGGIISLLTTAWVVFLLVGKFHSIIYPEMQSTVLLDKEHVEGQRKVFINFDITVKTKCTMIHIDLFEHDGRVQTDIIDNITRYRYAEDGMDINQALEKKVKANKKAPEIPAGYCGKCILKTDKECCNTCKEIMDVYKSHGLDYYSSDSWDQCEREGVLDFGAETCRIKGKIKVKKQSGNFHIAIGKNIPGASRSHTHDLSGIKPIHRTSHIIHSLTVGDPVDYYTPPLTNVEMDLPDLNGSNYWMANYFLHAVPERLSSSSKIDSYRYTAFPSQRTVSLKSKKGFPGIVFYYDFAPMVVVSYPNYQSLRGIIVDICGIIGGAFSFAAIIDAFTFGALSSIRGKTRIGKIA